MTQRITPQEAVVEPQRLRVLPGAAERDAPVERVDLGAWGRRREQSLPRGQEPPLLLLRRGQGQHDHLGLELRHDLEYVRTGRLVDGPRIGYEVVVDPRAREAQLERLDHVGVVGVGQATRLVYEAAPG